MLNDIDKSVTEKAGQPLMNNADVERNTVSQPGGKKWGACKVAVV
jgi:hypothetical protein